MQMPRESSTGYKENRKGIAHIIPVDVGELGLLLVEGGGVDRLPAAEGTLHNVARDVILKLCAHKRRALARLDMQELCAQGKLQIIACMHACVHAIG